MSNQQAAQDPLLNVFLIDWKEAKNDAQRNAAVNRFIKQSRAQGLNEALTKSLEELMKLGPDKLGKAMELTLTLSQQQASKRQELESKQADILMNLMSEPGKTKANIASFAVGLSTICRFFGANQFADMVEGKAKEIMATIRDDVQLDTSRIESGSNAIDAGLKTALDMYKRSNATELVTAGANKGADVNGPAPFDPYMGGESTPATNPKLTMQQFKANVDSLGLNIDPNTLIKLNKAFITSAAMKVGGDNNVLEKNETSGFLMRVEKILPQDKFKQVKSYIEMAAERGPS